MTKHIILLCALLIFVGCGRQNMPDGMLALHPCQIIVTRDGQPFAMAEVKLYPVESQKKDWSTTGLTETNGVIDLRTNANYSGVPAGKYKIIVVKEDIENVDNNFYYRVNTVDPKFGTMELTPLEIEIKSGKNKQTVEVGPEIKTRIGGKLRKSNGGTDK
ncbi:MAG: hypothetical protein LBJ00_18625 [Planctomycetaceae bacterium]|jgi:5-hydroxyisourate hydrolase-like protein (transthyretin family)|nr:hypothetical protein [Planctomycetaceae bacterium]